MSKEKQIKSSLEILLQGFHIALYLFAFVAITELSHYIIAFFWLLFMFCIHNIKFTASSENE